MGKAGHRNVPLNAVHAARAAKWLRQVAIPHLRSRPGTVLAADFNKEEAARLEDLAAVLCRKAARKRADAPFVALISIEQAAAFARAVSAGLHQPLHRQPNVPLAYRMAVTAVALAMADAGKAKRRARPSLTPAEVEAIASGKVVRENRQVQRIVARYKQEAVREVRWNTYVRGLKAREETILTAAISFREI